MSAERAQSFREMLAKIQTALDNLYNNPRPTYSVDGQSVSHAQLRKDLLDEYESIMKLAQAEEPFELRTVINP